jgi:hypothetical protein
VFASGFIAVTPDAAGECVMTLGDRSCEGIVVTSDAPSRFAARFPSLSDALLFVELEGAAPNGFHVGFWLSTYGLNETTVGELERSLDEVVTRLVAPEVAATL